MVFSSVHLFLLMFHCVFHDLVLVYNGRGSTLLIGVSQGAALEIFPFVSAPRVKSTEEETSPKSLKISATFASSQLGGMFLTYKFLSWACWRKHSTK